MATRQIKILPGQYYGELVAELSDMPSVRVKVRPGQYYDELVIEVPPDDAVDITNSFPNTYYVSTDGDDSLTGTSPAQAWQTIGKVNGASLLAGDTVRFNRGDLFGSNLVPPVAGLIFDAYGDTTEPLPIIGAVQDITNAEWVDNGSSIPGTWTLELTSASLPARCQFTAPWIDDDDRIGKIGSGIAKAGSQADVSVDILGVEGNWTQTRQNLWQRSTAFTFTSSRQPAFLSINGETPIQGMLFQGDPSAEGEWHTGSSGSVLTIYSTGGNPATTYSSLRVSGGWTSSTVSGTTRRITVFSPGGIPSTNYTKILLGGNGASGSEALNLTTGGHTFRNIQFLGTDTAFSSTDNLTDCLFENCDFRLSQTRAGRVENGCHRWTFKNCRISENGLHADQSANGLMASNSTSDVVDDLRLIDCELSFNGGDGFVPQSAPSSRTTIAGCTLAHNGENPIDLKGNEEPLIIDTLCLSSIMSSGAGTIAITAQFRSRPKLRRSVFVGTLGRFDNTGAGKAAFNSSGQAVVDAEECIFCGSSGDEVRPGNDSNSGPATLSPGKTTMHACLVVGTRSSSGSVALRLSSGDLELKHCTVAHKAAGTNAKAISQTPGSGSSISATVTVQNVVVENSILFSNGTSTSAYLYERSATSLDNVTATLTNNIYFQSANPTNWLNGGDSNLITQAELDADVAATGFNVTNSIADPTADPMFDNPWEGGLNIVTSDLRGIGNWGIGGTLIHLTCSAISSSPNAPNLGERVTQGDASGYVRDIFADGLLLSSVDGTFAAGALTGQWGGAIATVSAVSADLTLKTAVWDAQASNFSTLGQVVTDSGSSDTGILVSQVDAGTSGRAVVAVASGVTFTNNGTLSGASDGSVTLDGVLLSSPARRAYLTVWPRILRGAPAVGSFVQPIGAGSLFENFAVTASGSDTISVVNATSTFSRSGATTFASQGARVGIKFYTNDLAAATIDVGGPFTIATLDDSSFTTTGAPGDDVTNSSSAELILAGDADAGCYPIA